MPPPKLLSGSAPGMLCVLFNGVTNEIRLFESRFRNSFQNLIRLNYADCIMLCVFIMGTQRSPVEKNSMPKEYILLSNNFFVGI